jgi:hypothetical protein
MPFSSPASPITPSHFRVKLSFKMNDKIAERATYELQHTRNLDVSGFLVSGLDSHPKFVSESAAKSLSKFEDRVRCFAALQVIVALALVRAVIVSRILSNLFNIRSAILALGLLDLGRVQALPLLRLLREMFAADFLPHRPLGLNSLMICFVILPSLFEASILSEGSANKILMRLRILTDARLAPVIQPSRPVLAPAEALKGE